MKLNTPKYIILPVSAALHGDITPTELEGFLRHARKSLSWLGFSSIETLNEGTECEKELWGDTEAVGLGLAVLIFSCQEADEIDIDWSRAPKWGLDKTSECVFAVLRDAVQFG